MKEITENEYNEFLKTSKIVVNEYCSFSSFCGPHSFTTEVINDGIRYELNWGWGWKDDHSKKDYSITELYKEIGQEGDGV